MKLIKKNIVFSKNMNQWWNEFREIRVVKKNINFEKLRIHTKLFLHWIEEEWKINIQRKLIDKNSEWNQLKIENHLILTIIYSAIHNSHIILWKMIHCEMKHIYNHILKYSQEYILKLE